MRDVQEIFRAGERAASAHAPTAGVQPPADAGARVLNFAPWCGDGGSSGVSSVRTSTWRSCRRRRVGYVKADPGQLEQVITNLAVNAARRHAARRTG